jgi:SAM-dependent methyltransferase
MAIDEQSLNFVRDWFGRELTSLPDRQFIRRLELAFRYWRLRGFPYPDLGRQDIELEFRRLEKTSIDPMIGDHLVSSTVGLRLANSFHPQMWRVPVHGRSPLACFRDDSTLRRALGKAARFWPDRRCWNDQCIRSVMRIYHRSRVSNFRPTAARSLIARFSVDGDTILDFSAGYGGRLLAALAMRRHYIGIDPARAQFKGLCAMWKELASIARGTAEIHQACAEDYLPKLPDSCAELVISSPPYFDHEKYSVEKTQSWRRYPTYPEWRQSFLRPVINHSHRLLKKGGYFLINVADLPRAPLVRDVLKLALPLFERRNTVKLWMSSPPLERARGGRRFRWEPILIFRKVN